MYSLEVCKDENNWASFYRDVGNELKRSTNYILFLVDKSMT